MCAQICVYFPIGSLTRVHLLFIYFDVYTPYTVSGFFFQERGIIDYFKFGSIEKKKTKRFGDLERFNKMCAVRSQKLLILANITMYFKLTTTTAKKKQVGFLIFSMCAVYAQQQYTVNLRVQSVMQQHHLNNRDGQRRAGHHRPHTKQRPVNILIVCAVRGGGGGDFFPCSLHNAMHAYELRHTHRNYRKIHFQ